MALNRKTETIVSVCLFAFDIRDFVIVFGCANLASTILAAFVFGYGKQPRKSKRLLSKYQNPG